ncbi:MAG: hypothetical protein R2932_34110 [Caldilineaceae bacterium]
MGFLTTPRRGSRRPRNKAIDRLRRAKTLTRKLAQLQQQQLVDTHDPATLPPRITIPMSGWN